MLRGRPRLSAKLRRAPTRYVPHALIAQGGMAEVWRAEGVFEDGTSHPVAIKRMRRELASNELYRSMFEDEARLGMMLYHPNIVRVYDARQVGGSYIMVMELVDGTTLRDLLVRAHERRAPMPVATALHVMRSLAWALEYTHDLRDQAGEPLSVVHRDVSPHNLLLSRDGAVKLTDFGLADAKVHRTELEEGMRGGKLGYLAPEVFLGAPSNPAIDLFGLGIILWEALAGQRLFERVSDQATARAVQECVVPRARRINPKIPEPVQAFLDALLMPDPDARLSSATEAKNRLDALISQVDPAVGPRDVALLVGLHLATEAFDRPQAEDGEAEVVAQELDEFAEVTKDTEMDLAAEPKLQARRYPSG